MRTPFLLLAAALAAASAQADIEPYNGYDWTYHVEGDVAVLGLNGPFDQARAVDPAPTGTVSVPGTLGGKPVTVIGHHAFFNCGDLTTPSLPATVTNIGAHAFEGCRSLDLGDGQLPVKLEEIGDCAFLGCQSIRTVTMPGTLTRIGDGAFGNCIRLWNADIPGSVRRIGHRAFENCGTHPDLAIHLLDTNSIPGVQLLGDWVVGVTGALDEVLHLSGKGVRGIADGTFENCTNLDRVELPSDLIAVPERAFKGCTGLADAAVPDNAGEIGAEAFADCANLGTVAIGYGVTNIAATAFSGCGQAKLYVSDLYAGPRLAGMETGLSLTPSGDRTVPGETYVLPSNAVPGTVLRYTMDGTVPTATSPVLVTQWDPTLERQVFPVSRPMTLTVGAFWTDGMLALTTHATYRFVETVGGLEWEFRPLPGSVLKAEITGVSPMPAGATTIPAELGGMAVKRIGAGVFEGCTAMTAVAIPGTVTDIGTNAFAGCTGLGHVVIPDSVTNIAARAFHGCTGLAFAAIGNGVEADGVGNDAFTDTGVETLWASDLYGGPRPAGGKDVRYVLTLSPSDDNPLLDPEVVEVTCNISGATVRFTTDGTAPTAESPVFESFTANGGMTVTVGAFLDGELLLTSRRVYRMQDTVGGAYTWTYRVENGKAVICGTGDPLYGTGTPGISPAPSGALEIPATLGGLTVAGVGEWALFGCSNVTSVTIPATVTAIGDHAFRNCSGLAAVRLPAGLETIGDYAFNGCAGLSRVAIPDAVTDVGFLAFGDCPNLSLATVGNGVRVVPSSPFGTPRPAIYVSDLYAGPSIEGATVGLSLSPSAAQVLTGPTEISVACIVPGATVRFTTDGTAPTAESPVFAPFTASGGTTVTVGAFLDGERVLTTRGVYRMEAEGDGGYTWTYRVEGGAAVVHGASDPSAGTIVPAVSPAPAGHVPIPAQLGGRPVVGIGEYSFYGCAGMTGVTIPDTVAFIGADAFYGCSGLEAVWIPDGVAGIGDRAFAGCTGLEHVKVPDGAASIGERAFSGCIGLKWAAVGDGVTTIGGCAFEGCTGLEWLALGNDVASIGGMAFFGTAATIYVSDRYAGPDVGATVGLSLSLSDAQPLVAPAAVSAVCAVPGGPVLRFSTDGAPLDNPSPAFEPFVVDIPMRLKVGAFVAGVCVLSTERNYRMAGATGFVSLGGKGVVEKRDGGYFATANDGVFLSASDFLFTLDPDAYAIAVAADGRTATVRLKPPAIGVADGGTGIEPDPDDPSGLLVLVPRTKALAVPASVTDDPVPALPVKSFPGLVYRTTWGDALGDFAARGAEADVTAGGTALYLGVVRQTGGSGFYKVSVSEPEPQ